MNKTDMPDCFCDNDGMSSCDWAIDITVQYSRKGIPDDVVYSLPWKLENIPHALAQLISTAAIDALNKQGIKIWQAWREGCAAGDDMKEIETRVLKAAGVETTD